MPDSTIIPGLGGISGDPRQSGGRMPSRGKQSSALERKAETPSTVPDITHPAPTPDPTSLLIQALDRLRATQELRPVETELVRALRGALYYHDESHHDLPVLDDVPQVDLDGLPPDQVG